MRAPELEQDDGQDDDADEEGGPPEALHHVDDGLEDGRLTTHVVVEREQPSTQIGGPAQRNAGEQVQGEGHGVDDRFHGNLRGVYE